MSSADLLVYDNHNVIYAYGNLDAHKNVLAESGLHETEMIRFPVPHVHHYNSEFDSEEVNLLQHFTWKQFPLQESDEL
jgi:hypothetical protein